MSAFPHLRRCARTGIHLAAAGLVAVSSLHAQPVISEFMASNRGVVLDGDGNSSDWIEVHNPGGEAVDLGGWKLRDAANVWTFPSVTIPAGGYLVVFASGRTEPGYVDAGGFLHCDFRLDASGESPALLAPDGTVAFEFPQPMPDQREDVSFGLFSETTNLAAHDSPARIVVPSAPVDAAWAAAPGFDDSAWRAGNAAVGFNLDPGPVLEGGGAVTAYVIDAGTEGNQAYGGALGMDFEVDETVQVTHLGVFDDRSDGLNATIVAELWSRDDRGTPGSVNDDVGRSILATLTFTPVSPGTLEGGSRMKPLAAPLDLEPGSYTIVAHGYGASERNGNMGTAGGDWEIEDGDGRLRFVGGGRYGNAGSFPPTVDGGPVNRYAAGTFKFAAASDPLILSDLRAAMAGISASALVRIPFTVQSSAAFDALSLDIAYDDGFVAWINGTEVARRNAPAGGAPAFDAPAAAIGGLREAIPISLPEGVLRDGANVLAIHGLNLSPGDRDFLMAPRLDGVRTDVQAVRFFTVPTPGAPNDPSGIAGFVQDTKFSIDRGFFDAPFTVEITTATEGAEIRFTTDGSAPTPTTGTIYSGPITIASTTVLRAAAFRDSFEPSNVDTQTYLFLDEVAVQGNSPAGYPASWGPIAADYAMDPSPTDYARAAGDNGFTPAQARAAIAESLRAIPTLSIVTDVDHLFDTSTGIYLNPSARGVNWERPVSVELIRPDGSTGFQIDAGLRIMGFTSRNLSTTPKLNMRLLFRKEYGAGTLDYPLFEDGGPTMLNTLTLRANIRDSWVAEYFGAGTALYIGDQWAKTAQREMGQPAVRGTFVHLYLNGIYWGLYNPTERPDTAFAEAHFGHEREEYDVVKFCCPHRVVDGDMNAWNELLGLSQAGLTSDVAYQFMQGNDADGNPDPEARVLIDVDNFIDYVINGQYHASVDWPGNYYVMRDRVEDRTRGFLFFTWDNDLVFGGGNPNSGNKVQTDPGNNWWTQSPGVMDIALRRNAEYRLRFADRVYHHFFHDGALTVENNIARWNRFADLVRPALFAESARWGDYRGSIRTVQDHWDTMHRRMVQTYFPNRQAVVFQQLRTHGLYPDLAAPEFNQHGGAVPPGFALRFSADAEVFYTLDGTDPRLPGGAPAPTAQRASAGASTTPLVDESTPARVRVPADDSAGTAWRSGDGAFDDSGWLAGPAAIGFEGGSGYEDLIGLDLDGMMQNINASVYVRIPFEVADTGAIQSLALRMKYDDGFVAWINGTEVARANAPAAPSWNSSATGSHADVEAVVFEAFDLTSRIGLLRDGPNILTIQGLNVTDTSSDFLAVPRLEAITLDGGTAVPLAQTVQVRARTFDGSEWSALNQATFVVGNPADASNLAVSEIHYHPPANAPVEFVELMNVGSGAIDLTGVAFDEGVEFAAAQGTTLAPGERAVIVQDLAAFRAAYGESPRVLGTFGGGTQLNNGGETITLTNATLAPSERIIRSFTFDDAAPWPESPDGGGFTLVLKAPESNPDHSIGENWTASSVAGGSPGSGDAGRPLDDWLASHGLAGRGPLDDPNGDGISLLVDYALNGVPGGASGTARPLDIASLDPDARTITLAFTRNPAATDIALAFESSAALNGWTPVTPSETATSPGPNGLESVTATFTLPAGSEARFIRLVVTAH